MKIRVFGQLTEFLGSDQIELPHCHSVEDLRINLESLFPMVQGKTYVVSVNQVIQEGAFLLESGSEIALLPPFSGG